MAEILPAVLALHYWLPDMAQTRRLCQAIKKCAKRPVMIADAASMYSAKAAGLASEFDIFTPDATEMAFRAIEDKKEIDVLHAIVLETIDQVLETIKRQVAHTKRWQLRELAEKMEREAP